MLVNEKKVYLAITVKNLYFFSNKEEKEIKGMRKFMQNNKVFPLKQLYLIETCGIHAVILCSTAEYF